MAWNLDPLDSGRVDKVTLKFAEPLSAGSFICVQVDDNNIFPFLANGCTELDSPLAAETSSPPVDFPSPGPSAAAINFVSLTVTQPVAALTAPPGLQVTGVRWVVNLDDDTTTVDRVKVTVAGVNGTFRVRLRLRNPAGALLSETTFPSQPLQQSGTTITWDPVLPMPPFLDVFAQDIARFDILVNPP